MFPRPAVRFNFCRNRFLPLYALLAVLALSGCRDRVQDEFPDFTPVPVLNCFLVGDSLIQVHVSLAGKLDTAQPTLVDKAMVICTINDSLTIVLKSDGHGFYSGKTIAKEGNIYRFAASVPGFPELTASDTIPQKSRLTSVKHINLAGIDEEGNTFPAVQITFPVDPDQIRYFQVVIRYDHYGNWYTGQLKAFKDPVLLAGGLPITAFSTAGIRDTVYTMQIDYTTGSVSSIGNVSKTDLYPFVVEFKAISFQYFQYLRQLYLYNYGRYPDFQFGPYKGFPLYSNVTNGMGIVAAYSKFVSELITPEE
jgi:hypothetical protein